MTDDSHPRHRTLYGRRKGKTLKPKHRALLAEDLGPLSLPGVSPRDNPERAPIDPEEFAAGRPLWLEIGFGGGEHLVHQAAANPGVALIGCEPFINGVAMLLAKVRDAGVDNLRLYPGDVRDLFDVLPDACLARAFLLYPDPWPKLRHHRRRFVTPEYLHPLSRVMRPGAILRIATDIPDYVRQTMEEVPQAGFIPLNPEPEDWHAPWDDWISTRYEQKALREGRTPHYLTFSRTTG
jgi:tRNA (guanine-N7-)-methyltransferase